MYLTHWIVAAYLLNQSPTRLQMPGRLTLWFTGVSPLPSLWPSTQQMRCKYLLNNVSHSLRTPSFFPSPIYFLDRKLFAPQINSLSLLFYHNIQLKSFVGSAFEGIFNFAYRYENVMLQTSTQSLCLR